MKIHQNASKSIKNGCQIQVAHDNGPEFRAVDVAVLYPRDHAIHLRRFLRSSGKAAFIGNLA